LINSKKTYERKFIFIVGTSLLLTLLGRRKTVSLKPRLRTEIRIIFEIGKMERKLKDVRWCRWNFKGSFAGEGFICCLTERNIPNFSKKWIRFES
jgi:hypothetical protein